MWIANDFFFADIVTFYFALWFYFTNTKIKEINLKKLSDINQPVKTVIAQYKGRNITKVSEEKTNNLCLEF
jgi:hypothetical protein